MVKNPPANAGDAGDSGLVPLLGRFPGGANGNPLQYFCLGDSRDRGAWWAAVHVIAESDMTEQPSTHALVFICRCISVQFSSVTQLCPTLCDPMNRSTPGLPVHHQLPEFTQTHVHRVGDAIQPSHPLSCPPPPAPNPSQRQGLFQ